MGGLSASAPLMAEHDRVAFDCGREPVNHWLWRHAWANHQSGISRVSVVCDEASGAIAAYVALSVAQMERMLLPKPAQRNKPAAIPVLLLGQLAVDRAFQGRGIAASLLAFTFRTALRISHEAGCFGVLTHPLDDSVRDFYSRFGFRDLDADPKRSMIVRLIDLGHSGLQ